MIGVGSWNVRGLNKRDHQYAITTLIQEFRLDILAVIETRVQRQNYLSIQKNIHRSWHWYADYVGGPGKRIWLGWDNSEMDVQILEAHDQLVHCRVTMLRVHK